MSKSAILVNNTASQIVLDGGTVNLGTIIRRFGCNCNYNANGVTINGSGYYKVSGQVTLTGTNAGVASLSIFKDDVEYSPSKVSQTIVGGDIYTIPFLTFIRKYDNEEPSVLRLVLSDETETINAVSMIVEKM